MTKSRLAVTQRSAVESGFFTDCIKYLNRHADYKPVPPPKSSAFKPVPPPKPKSYPRPQSAKALTQMEGNYMNSGGLANGRHYHHLMSSSQRIQPHHPVISHSNNSQKVFGYQSMPGGNVDDHDSNNGFDSGQGSSLDREYNNPSYNHHRQSIGNLGHVSNISSSQNSEQYYCNLPPPKKDLVDGLDLSNREYRGSAFELYKKPLEYNTMQQQL